MKLEIKVGNKELIEPEFKIFVSKENESMFFLAMKVDVNIENMIRENMANDEFKVVMQNGIIGLTISNEIYSFDIRGFLRNHLTHHYNDHFYVAFAFLDSEDKMKIENVKAIRMKHK
jgi:hypothetical protein